MYKAINKIVIVTEIDEYPDLSYLGNFDDAPGDFPIQHSNEPGEYHFFNASNVENMEQALQNYKKVIAYNNNEWSCLIVSAEAEINVNGTPQTITSSGFCGIESDSPESIKEVENEQLNELRDVLICLGFTVEEFGKACFEKIKYKE